MDKKILACLLILAGVFVVVGCSRSPAPVAAEASPTPTPPSAEAAPRVSPATEQTDKRDDRILQMVGRAILTADGRNVAFLSRDVDYLYVLRLEGGELDRLRRHFGSLKDNPRIDLMVSTNGSAVLYRDGTVQSLTGLHEKQLTSYNESLRSESLGFADARRVLAFHGKTSALELIDTEKDQVIWSVPVGAGLADWESRPQRWSPTRRFIAWADGINVTLLSMENGQTRSFSPPAGMHVDMLLFSKDERSLLVQDTAAVSGRPNAALFNIYTSQRTELTIPGSVLDLEAGDGKLVAFDAGNRMLSVRPETLGRAAGWQTQLPVGAQVTSMDPQGVIFAAFDEPGASTRKLLYALNANQPSSGPVEFRAVNTGDSREPHWLTLGANRYAVLTEGTRVHVYDLQQLAIGRLSVRTIDLMTEQKALSEPAVVDPPAQALAVQWTAEGGGPAVAAAAGAAPDPVAGSDPSDPNRIVKCQDGSGSVAYVRGSCPDGATMIGAPEIQKKKLTPIEKLVKQMDEQASDAQARGEAESKRYVSAADYGKSRWIKSNLRTCGGNTVVIYESEATVDGRLTRLFSGTEIKDRMYFSLAGAAYANCNAGQGERKR